MGGELKNLLFLVVGIVLGLVGLVGFLSTVNKQPLPVVGMIGYAIVFALGAAFLTKYKG